MNNHYNGKYNNTDIEFIGNWDKNKFEGIYNDMFPKNNILIYDKKKDILSTDNYNYYDNNFNWFYLKDYLNNDILNPYKNILIEFFIDDSWEIASGSTNGLCAVYAVFLSLYKNSKDIFKFPQIIFASKNNEIEKTLWNEQNTIPLFIKINEIYNTNEDKAYTLENISIGVDNTFLNTLGEDENKIKEQVQAGIGTLDNNFFQYFATIKNINIFNIYFENGMIICDIYLPTSEIIFIYFSKNDADILNKIKKTMLEYKTIITMCIKEHYYTLYNNDIIMYNTIMSLIYKVYYTI